MQSFTQKTEALDELRELKNRIKLIGIVIEWQEMGENELDLPGIGNMLTEYSSRLNGICETLSMPQTEDQTT